MVSLNILLMSGSKPSRLVYNQAPADDKITMITSKQDELIISNDCDSRNAPHIARNETITSNAPVAITMYTPA